ncbi:MAG TPA: hypothetical protein VNO30_27875 [Kofleriaceae bacterium]|nr:hypothetical protein [Kofleriaceae bacterium]
MTDSLFKITPTPPSSIKLEPGQVGKLSFTVESLAAPDKVHEVLLQALLVGDGGKEQDADWLVAKPQGALRMSGGKTETVAITASPTAASPRGEHRIKLVIADKDRPNDVFADSPPVTCEVLGPATVTKPPRKFPWWLIAVIAGGLLLVGGGVLLVWKLAGKEPGGPLSLGERCGGDTTRACDQGLLCAGRVGKCLLVGGAECKPAQAAQCASGECESKAGVCAIPLGGACQPGDKDLVPCPRSSTCDPVTKTCLGNVGAACKADAECTTGTCTGQSCAVKAPAVNAGDPCESTCPAPLQCSATTKRCVEEIGRPCSNNNQCATGLCEENACATPGLLRDCTRDGICGLDQKCLEFQPGLKRCKWQPGHACHVNANDECSSKWCNQGVCSRDDGKCKSQSDCPSPYLCITAKEQCLKPNGQVCGGDGQCDSNFCNQNRCEPPPCLTPCKAGYHCNNALSQPMCVRDLRFPSKFLVAPWIALPSVH